MALDEAILNGSSHCVLRVYRWDALAVSFGYRQKWEDVAKAFPGLPLVRRWTGGGIVEHGRDWTFSLMAPREQSFAGMRAGESYRWIHEAIVTALNAAGQQARLAGCEECAPAEACFVSPSMHDVLGPDGRKLCGGAQRRNRVGLLHQGSVQNLTVPPSFAPSFAEALAETTAEFLPNPAIFAEMKRLISEKYGNPDWLRRIS